MTAARIAVVGAGPAGMYAVGHLLGRAGPAVEIDLYERLATPWGLVRSGVAPDHPEKKLIAERLFDFSLNDGRVRFIGNVDIGGAISHADLAARYHAVVYAVGAGGDLAMDVPGEDLHGCFSARSFVGFYNGHPDFQQFAFDLSSERAIIVGNGNVALDIARILCTPVADLEKTDIADNALDLLRHSKVREVVLLARRGPHEAAFNNPELEELAHLADVDIAVEGTDIHQPAPPASWETERKLDLLRRLAGRPPKPGNKRIVFRFLASPLAVLGASASVEALRIAENTLVADAAGNLRAQPSGREETIPTGLVFRAIGYRGTPFPGLPFDARTGTITNRDGRVVDGNGRAVPGAYVTGWIKRGCRGIIGTNRRCAQQTVELLLEDLHLAAGREVPPSSALAAWLEEKRAAVLSRDDWRRIDRRERDDGRRLGRPRVKIVDRPGQLAAARQTPPAAARQAS